MHTSGLTLVVPGLTHDTMFGGGDYAPLDWPDWEGAPSP